MATATKIKVSSQDQFVAFAIDNGWVLDTSDKINTFGGWGSFNRLSPEDQARYIKQNPFAFIRPVANGGIWKVEFRFTSNGRIRAAELRYFNGNEQIIGQTDNDGRNSLSESGYAYGDKGNWPGNPRCNIMPVRLFTPTPNNSSCWLGDVTRGEDNPLRKQVELLLTNPDLVVWLAAEYKFKVESRWAAERAEKDRVAALRNRPEPKGWFELHKAALAVTRSNGLSDHAALIDALINAAAGVDLTTAPERVQ